MAKSRPSLHAKLVAYKGDGPLRVTPAEARLLRALNQQTLKDVKAGTVWGLLLGVLGTPAGLILVEFVVKAIVGDKTPSAVANFFVCFFDNMLGHPDSPACTGVVITATPKGNG